MSVALYITAGTFLSLAIWCLQRPRWKAASRVSCALVLAMGATLITYFEATSTKTLGTEHWYKESPIPESCFFFLMLVGMASRYFTRAIEVRRERIVAVKKRGGAFDKPGLEFDAWEFSYPLFLSVVTFGALLTQIKDDGISIRNMILSFQTGFFWQTLLVIKQQGKT
ncbi:MAG: hypothetical protein ABSD67_23760 [Terracidiphilus sp.]